MYCTFLCCQVILWIELAHLNVEKWDVRVRTPIATYNMYCTLIEEKKYNHITSSIWIQC